jgi:hypothetical protein
MKVRDVVIFSGEAFSVPQCIQRIDTRSTHGWQVRYHGTKMFSDHSPDGSGARAALERATKELLKRIAEHPAPVALQRAPSAHKTSDLPSGISGPIVRTRRNAGTRVAVLSVLLPQFGKRPKCTTIHIGSENTYTPRRFKEAVARAIELRNQAEQVYEQEATRARRREGVQLRNRLREAAGMASQGAAAD